MWLLAMLACTAEPVPDPEPDACVRQAVVTDIDETLTVSDGEWLRQLIDGTDIPEARPDAATLMQAYADAGYGVFYVTARGELGTLTDGRTSREATADWLTELGFPFADDRLFLAEGIGAFGDEAADYKIEVLEGVIAEGWRFDYAYGNASSDIEAFAAVSVPPANLYGVGDGADALPSQPVPTEDAFTAHLSVVPSIVQATCSGAL